MNGLYALEVLVNLADQISGPILGPIGRLEELQGVARQADLALEQMASGAGIAALGAAIGAPLALATNEAIKFESAMADVRKVVDFPTPEAPMQLQNDLLELSTQIPRSATDLTQIAAAAGAAGIGFDELTTFTEDAAKMSVAFGITAQQSGDDLAQMRNIFGLSQNDVRGLGDAVNYLSNNMAAEAPAILDVLTRVGGTARVVGMTSEQLAGLASAMLSTGTAPEVVSTGLNALIMRLSTATQQSKDFQTGLEGLGLGARELETSMRTDAAGSIESFLGIVAKSKDPLSTLSLLFGSEYADDIAKMTTSVDLVSQGLSLAGDRAGYAGSMSAEYGVRAATTANKLQLLWNQVTILGMRLGEILLPPLNKAIDAGSKFLSWVDDMVQRFPGVATVAIAVTAGLSGLLIVLGTVVLGLGALSGASAQARLGLEFLRLTTGQLRAGFGSTVGVVQSMYAELVRLGAGAAVANGAIAGTSRLAAQLQLEATATGMARVRLALAGVGQMFLSAASGARVFALSLLANPVFLITAAIIGLAAAFVWAWQNVDEFRTNVLALLAPLGAAFADLRQSFFGILEALGPVGSAIAGVFSGVPSILDALAFAFGFALGFILTLVTGVFVRIVQVVTQLLGGVLDIIRGVINTIVGLFTGDMDKARAGVATIFLGILKIVTAPLRLVGIEWFEVKASLEQLWNWMTDWAKKAWQWGADLIGGITRGITGNTDQVGDAMRGVGDVAEGAYRDRTQTRSPSRLMYGLAAFLPIGAALGITENAFLVGRAIQDMMDVPAVFGTAPDALEFGSGTFTVQSGPASSTSTAVGNATARPAERSGNTYQVHIHMPAIPEGSRVDEKRLLEMLEERLPELLIATLEREAEMEMT